MGAENNPELAVELAQRLLAQPYGRGGYPTVELIPGGLPAVSGVELVVPTGGRLLGSAVERRDGELSAVQAVVDFDRSMGAAMEAYGQALRSAGWTEANFGGGMGFIPSTGGPPHMFRKGQRGPVLMLNALARSARETELRLRLDFSMPQHMPPPHRQPQPMAMIPSLYGPAGVEMVGGGGGGSDSSWSTHATARTTMPLVELESFFADQLERDGWTRLSGGADDVAAWSSWKVRDKPDWHAILIVLALPESEERWMTLHLQRRARGGGGGWASAVSELVRH